MFLLFEGSDLIHCVPREKDGSLPVGGRALPACDVLRLRVKFPCKGDYRSWSGAASCHMGPMAFEEFVRSSSKYEGGCTSQQVEGVIVVLVICDGLRGIIATIKGGVH